jgi:hypothetical protein
MTKIAIKMTTEMTRGLMRRTRPKRNATRTLVMPTRILIEAFIASLVEGRSRKWVTRKLTA